MVDKLTEKCTENVEDVKLAKITSAEDENKHNCSSCTLKINSILIPFTTNVGIGNFFAYFYRYLKKMLFVLVLIPVLKQQFNEFINGKSRANRDQKSKMVVKKVNMVKILWKLKSDCHLPKNIFSFCFNDSPSKMMRNAFYFFLKALFVLKIFKFLSLHFGHVDKRAWLER